MLYELQKWLNELKIIVKWVTEPGYMSYNMVKKKAAEHGKYALHIYHIEVTDRG